MSINMQPTLVGKLIKIRPVIASDFESLAHAASDPLIWQQHPEPRRHEKQYFKDRFFAKALSCGGGLVFQKGDRLVGSSRYYNYRQGRDIMIGYTFLTRDCWGAAHNRQIKHLMLTHAYRWLDTVLFTVGASNQRSRAAMLKIGGRLLSQSQIAERDLKADNSVIFEIKKKDFKGLID